MGTPAAPEGPPQSEPSDVAPEAAPITVRMPVDVRSVSLTVIAVLATIVLLRYAEALLIPLVLGVLAKYALDPIVGWLVEIRIPRPIAAAVVLLSVVAAGGALAYQLRFQAAAMPEQLPEAARQIRERLEHREGTGTQPLKQVQEAASELDRAAEAAALSQADPEVTRVRVERPPLDVTGYLLAGSMGIAAAIAQFVLILFLAYFLLASGDLYRRKLVKIVGSSLGEKKITVQILDQIDQQIAYFLLLQVFTCVVVGFITWLTLRWIGLEQAGMWGLLAGLFNTIPYFGPAVATSAIGLAAFMQFGTVGMTVAAAGAAFTITSLEGMLLKPWLNSRAGRMNAASIFIGLLFWGWVWQFWGLLLAVPLMMVVKTVSEYVEDLNPVSELLGD